MQAWQVKPGMMYRKGRANLRVDKVTIVDNIAALCLVDSGTGYYVDDLRHRVDTELGESIVDDGARDTFCGEQMGVYNNTTSVGTDFEVFAVNRQGRVVPAWKITRKQQNKGRSGGSMDPQVFADGFALEASICPSDCHESVVARMSEQIKQMSYVACNHRATLTTRVCVDVADQLKEAGDEAQLGCMPSINAYGEPPLVVDGACVPFRSAGMHVHYGVGPRWVEAHGASEIVKNIDAIAGVTMTSVVGGWDDIQRRKLYGKAGEYRLPRWGLEYRVGSVAVMRHPAITHLWLDLCRAGLWNVMHRVPWVVQESTVRRVIDNGLVEAARRILKRNVVSLTKIVGAMYTRRWGQKATDRTIDVLIEGGVEQMIPTLQTQDTDLWKTWMGCEGIGRKWGYYAGDQQ